MSWDWAKGSAVGASGVRTVLTLNFHFSKLKYRVGRHYGNTTSDRISIEKGIESQGWISHRTVNRDPGGLGRQGVCMLCVRIYIILWDSILMVIVGGGLTYSYLSRPREIPVLSKTVARDSWPICIRHWFWLVGVQQLSW